MNCEYCNKEFSNKNNLKTHQKSAKYCLKIQEDNFNNSNTQNSKNEESEIFLCDYCNKHFTYKHVLNKHHQICKNRQIIEDLKKEKDDLRREKDELLKIINKLQTTISDMANSKPTLINSTTNNTTNNISNNIVVNNNRLNLNDVDQIQNVLEQHLDGDVLCNGQKGLARMIYEKLLIGEDGKSMYKCVDPSRHNFEYINEDGQIVRDVKASKLTSALIKGDVCQKAMDLGNDMWKKEDGSVDSLRFEALSNKVFEVANINRDDSKFRSELSALAC